MLFNIVNKLETKIVERGNAIKSIQALTMDMLIPSTPSLLLFFKELTIVIISKGSVGNNRAFIRAQISRGLNTEPRLK